MLPPGHIAAGFLAAEALLKIAKPDLSPAQTHQMYYWGMIFGFLPDLDNFVAFAKVRSWWYKPGTDSNVHRKFFSHIPALWLIAGLVVYFFARSEFVSLLGLMLWLGSWAHFLLDSIDYGVMWLWPFNKELWAFKNRGIKSEIAAQGFVDYWLKYLKIATFGL